MKNFSRKSEKKVIEALTNISKEITKIIEDTSTTKVGDEEKINIENFLNASSLITIAMVEEIAKCLVAVASLKRTPSSVILPEVIAVLKETVRQREKDFKHWLIEQALLEELSTEGPVQ